MPPPPRLERFAAALENLFHETHEQALLPQAFLEAHFHVLVNDLLCVAERIFVNSFAKRQSPSRLGDGSWGLPEFWRSVPA